MSRVQSSSSASTVGIKDSAGNALTSTDGALNVNVSGTAASLTPVFVFNEVLAVAVGIETLVASYTASVSAYLQYIASSGQNIGEIRVYLNGSVVDKSYLYYTQFNLAFDFRTTIPAAPGLSMAPGDVVAVKALNMGQDASNFNAKLQILEEAA